MASSEVTLYDSLVKWVSPIEQDTTVYVPLYSFYRLLPVSVL